MTPGADVSHLRQLVHIITESIDTIEQLAHEQGVSHPTIDDLFDSKNVGEKFTFQPDVLQASKLAISAASQLISTLKLPGFTLLDRSASFHVPSCLRIAAEAGIVELLREAGPKGMHTQEIGAKAGVQPTMIGRTLRLLASHYIFRELTPNVFVNNRISSMMDTGKSSAEIFAIASKKTPGVHSVQGEKFIGTNGVVATVEHSAETLFKSSACLPEIVIANDYSKTAFQKGMQFDGTMWEFFNKHPGYLQRFHTVLGVWTMLQPTELNPPRFDWSLLPEGSLVIDVGAGDGSEMFEVAKMAPHLKLMVQDREQTIQEVTTPTWLNDPVKKRMIESGQVTLQAQNFHEPQPSHLVNKVSMYFMRTVTHNWPTSENIKLLKHLHAAAPPHCRLIIADLLIPHACADPHSSAGIEGAVQPTPPAPLLNNLGEANQTVYGVDFAMALLFNSQERTLGEFKEMTEAAGWKVQKVYQTPRSFFSQILCTKL